MSTINKKAFISKVLESLTSEQLTTLKGLVNGSTEPTFKSLINSTYGITSSDKGVKHIILETQKKTLSGYLIYNDTYCMIITYALNTQELSMFHILLNEQKVKAVSEYLDIDELRTLLDDSLIDGKVEALSSTGLKREVVQALPTGSAIQTNVIYLVPAQDTSTGNIYDEYMYINNAWEMIGSSATSGGSGTEVVELLSNSGTLSDDEFTKVSGNNCLIKYQSFFYRKIRHNTDLGEIVYTCINTSSYTWEENNITINTSTKAYFSSFTGINSVAANPTGTITNTLTAIRIGSNKYNVGMEIINLGDSNSGTLSAEDLAKVKTNNCILIRGGIYSFKYFQSSSGNDITYISSEHDKSYAGIQMQQTRITINGTSGSWTIGTPVNSVRDFSIEANQTSGNASGELTSLRFGGQYGWKYTVGSSVSYLTTAPSAANTSGRLQFVVLSSEPATKYDGYLYIITGSN